jgi:hypothetical protein
MPSINPGEANFQIAKVYDSVSEVRYPLGGLSPQRSGTSRTTEYLGYFN